MDGARVFLLDDELRTKLLAALTSNNRLATEEVATLMAVLQRTGSLQPDRLAARVLAEAPSAARTALLGWSRSVLGGGGAGAVAR